MLEFLPGLAFKVWVGWKSTLSDMSNHGVTISMVERGSWWFWWVHMFPLSRNKPVFLVIVTATQNSCFLKVACVLVTKECICAYNWLVVGGGGVGLRRAVSVSVAMVTRISALISLYTRKLSSWRRWSINLLWRTPDLILPGGVEFGLGSRQGRCRQGFLFIYSKILKCRAMKAGLGQAVKWSEKLIRQKCVWSEN